MPSLFSWFICFILLIQMWAKITEVRTKCAIKVASSRNISLYVTTKNLWKISLFILNCMYMLWILWMQTEVGSRGRKHLLGLFVVPAWAQKIMEWEHKKHKNMYYNNPKVHFMDIIFFSCLATEPGLAKGYSNETNCNL